MVCKKCSAPVDATAGVCSVCSTPVRKGGRVWPKYTKMAVVGVVLVASVVFVVLYTQGRIDFGFLTGGSDGQVTVPGEDGADYYEGSNEITNDPQAPEDEDADLVLRDEEERFALLQEVHWGVLDYMSAAGSTIPFVTGAGHLQNWEDGSFVTPQYLARLGFLGDEHLQETRFVFMLRPADLVGFEGINMPSTAEMTVFVGHETIRGIGLYSVHGYQEIFREDLNQVLENYTPRNWREAVMPPERPSGTSLIHQQAAAMISSTANGAEVDIRYMAFDEDFAFVAASMAGEAHRIRYFLFSVVGEVLSLLVHGFENVRHPIQAINQAAPNIDTHLLPDFLGEHTSSLLPPDDPVFANLMAILQAQGHIEPDNEPTFASAAGEFAYMVFAGGGVLFVNTVAGWELQSTIGWQQAEARMWELTELPPMYILQQN
ncbi:MAG: hypothetical protein FWB98_05645 [Defluviitaleaceae bacterium]|nr:hypothetical protein [Defluviitaleaceae bacterium]